MSPIMTPEGSKEFMDDLRKRSLRAARKHKITIDRLFKKLNEELEAHETKVFNDKENGLVYSEPLIAWKVRQEARRDAEAHLGIKPAEKVEHDLSGSLMAAVAAYLSGKKE